VQKEAEEERLWLDWMRRRMGREKRGDKENGQIRGRADREQEYGGAMV